MAIILTGGAGAVPLVPTVTGVAGGTFTMAGTAVTTTVAASTVTTGGGVTIGVILGPIGWVLLGAGALGEEISENDNNNLLGAALDSLDSF